MRTKDEPRLVGLTTILPLAIGTFATGTDAFIVAGLLPSIADSLQSSLALAGQMVTVFALAFNASALYLGIGLGGLLGGYVVDTWGADQLWLMAGGCGTLALLLLPISVAAERRAASAREVNAALR